jgi:hypothetical protein
MLKPNIELIRDGGPQVLLTWHKSDGQGGTIPIAMEFSDAVDAGLKQRIVDICERPISVTENGKTAPAFSGSSKHFLALPKVLERLGFRVRIF